jgi:hypothetical protein
MIVVGRLSARGGIVILVLSTTATTIRCAQITSNMALGLDWRAPTRGRLAAYASISNLLSQSGSVQLHVTT